MPVENHFNHCDMATQTDTYPEVIFTETGRELANIWIEYGHEIRHLSRGWTKDEGRRPLPCDVIWEKDIKICMRDGTKLMGDVFRPANTEEGVRVPAILPWSPYGKTGTGRLTFTGLAAFTTPMKFT